MEYSEALSYLQGLGRFGIRPGLARIELLLDRLERPQDRLQVIHVAGTNGKGSTAAMIASILRAAGYRTGLYTSPHLVSYTERITLDGVPIPPDRFAVLLGRIKGLLDPGTVEAMGHPTEFEVGTAVMYQYFAEEGAEVVVQETGLGGRLDATNIVKKPLITVITTIARDHTDRLGESLEAIAREKAGIIKPGVPVVSSPQEETALKVLEGVARANGCRFWLVGRDIKYQVERVSLEGTEFSFEGQGVSFNRIRTRLLGAHQAVNGATALAAMVTLRGLGWHIPDEAMVYGLAAVRWPGRLEVLHGWGAAMQGAGSATQRTGEYPQGTGVPLILDGAHNLSGARALAQALRELFPGRACVMVVAMMKDKDIPAVMAELAVASKAFVLTRIPDSRCAGPEYLSCFLPPGVEIRIEPDYSRALSVAARRAGANTVICVTGSLYLVGAVKSLIL